MFWNIKGEKLIGTRLEFLVRNIDTKKKNDFINIITKYYKYF